MIQTKVRSTYLFLLEDLVELASYVLGLRGGYVLSGALLTLKLLAVA